ncbi:MULTISPECIES: PKD domain-containing protein [unclassified Carboxylicivirga]|uniref:PKD domain-containing protein n=1 Tax=Carboxylicivirga TaxID=1628153 RepID=UPI003D32E166
MRVFIIGVLLLTSLSGLTAQGLHVKKLPFCRKNQSEIAPYKKDTLLFFSSDKNINWLNKLTDHKRRNFYNLFTVQQSADSAWFNEQAFESDFFSDFHTSTISFSPNGELVYFTEAHYKDKKRLQKGMENKQGVYSAQLDGNRLSRARSMPFNSRRSYNTGHPTLSADGRYLFFVSDQAGGYGGADIYVSERQGDEWGPALNLGATINTRGNEIFPFCHQSGKLYFASDSLGGQGGYDLFYTLKTKEGWMKPVPLDSGINTVADEFSCYISNDELQGYFASNRHGDDDLFEFIQYFPVFGPGQKQKDNTFRYRFYDRLGGKGDGPLKYVWYFGDGQKAEGDTVIHQYKAPGSYHVQSVLVDTLLNEELFVLNDFHQEVKKKVQVFIAVPDTLRVGQQVTLDARKSHLGEFVPNGYYWELPDGSRKKGVTIQHIFRKKGKQIIRCGTISADDPNKKMCTYKEINVIE